MKRAVVATLILCSSAATAQEEQWRFRVLLDDQPIGTHVFVLDTQDDARVLRSEANFTVKVLGIPVYRYQHEATEHWRNDCLRSLRSSTQDGGKTVHVELQEHDLKDCVMSYAYWNPQLLQQRQLLNAQTGKLDRVQIMRMDSAPIAVRGQTQPATRWRISGLDHPIDLWYANDHDQWLGLDSTVSGGRQLHYRLE